LSVSLVVVAGAVWLFASLVDAVLDNAVLVRFDRFADAMIHSHVTPAGLSFFAFMSRVGSPTTAWIVAVIGAVILLVRRMPTLFTTWVAVFAGGGLLEQVLKRAVHRSRPPYGTAYLTGVSFSFPSGHAMASMLGCAMVLYVVFIIARPRRLVRTLLASLAAVYLLLVGASRIYLGVHYPSDVLGGWAAGAAWVAICVSVASVVLHRRGFTLSSS